MTAVMRRIEHVESRTLDYGPRSTSTRGNPPDAMVADVYGLARGLRDRATAPIDWEAEAAVWADDTQAWADDAFDAAREAREA